MIYFNRFDICEAYYLYACDWHNGQFSKEYKIFGRLSKINFKPGYSLSYTKLTENGQKIYKKLCSKYMRGNL